MKIVDRATFLAMPSGTVFAKYEPCFFGELSIKGDNSGANDWYDLQLNGPWFEGVTGGETYIDRLIEIQDGKPSGELDYAEGRDALFDDGQLLAVWEKGDVAEVIRLLSDALSRGYVK